MKTATVSRLKASLKKFHAKQIEDARRDARDWVERHAEAENLVMLEELRPSVATPEETFLAINPGSPVEEAPDFWFDVMGYYDPSAEQLDAFVDEALTCWADVQAACLVSE